MSDIIEFYNEFKYYLFALAMVMGAIAVPPAVSFFVMLREDMRVSRGKR